MTAWPASATSRQARTVGCDHDQTSAVISTTSKAMWMAIQKRLREMPPRAGCTSSGRWGQNWSTTVIHKGRADAGAGRARR